MKKILTTLLIILMSIALFGCENKEEDISNAYKECNNLNEINKIANVEIIRPEETGITEEHYYIIEGSTASYTYELDGYKYHIRGTKDLSYDMSGIFKNGEPLFKNNDNQVEYGETDEYKAYRFFLGNIQYIFAVKDYKELDKEKFDEQFKKEFDLLCYAPTYEEITKYVGSYQDSTSQRATMEITLTNINTLTLDIIWPSSASEYDEWITSVSPVVYQADYEEIIHKRVTVDEKGNTKETLLDDYGPGYFEYDDEYRVKWTGSGNEQTSSCVFEKIS